jgi:D-lactate dehydrogenase
MHRDIYDIAERYGKDTFLMIDKLGTDKMPFFFTMKAAPTRCWRKCRCLSPLYRPLYAEAGQRLPGAFTGADENLAR